jgi:hypothetical protein
VSLRLREATTVWHALLHGGNSQRLVMFALINIMFAQADHGATITLSSGAADPRKSQRVQVDPTDI